MFYMEHSPAWEANRLSASQENLRILQYQKFQHCMHKCPSPVPILGQLDPVHAHISCFLKIQLNIILPSTPGTSKWSRSIRFPHQNPVYVILSPKRVTCPAHLIFLHLITRKILIEECRSLVSYSFLHSSVTLIPLRPKHVTTHSRPNFVPLTNISKF